MANFSQNGSNVNISAFNTSATALISYRSVVLQALLNVGYIEGYVLGALSFFANLAVLLTFSLHRALISPFTVHVLITTVINILVIVVYIPMSLAKTFHPNWFRIHNHCAAYLYLQTILLTMVVLQHLVVCIDRWLAILVPHWYRRKRSIKAGLLQAFLALVYLHIWFLPQLIPHLTDLYSTPPGPLCDSWKQTKYSVVVAVMTGLLPEVILYISYPVLMVFIWHRYQRRLQGRVGVHPANTNGETFDPDSRDVESAIVRRTNRATGNPATGSRGLHHANSRIMKRERSSRSRDVTSTQRSNRVTSGVSGTVSSPAGTDATPNKEAPVAHGSRKSKINRNTRLVLALLLVQIVLWTPVTVTSILFYTHNPPKYTLEAAIVARILSFLLFLIDPLFFFLFLPDLREAALRSLKQIFL